MAVQELQSVVQSPLAMASQDNKTDTTGVVQAAKPTTTLEQPPAVTGKKEDASHEKQVQAAAKQLDDFVKQHSIGLRFSVDSDTHEIVVKVVNKQSGETIRQIPSAEALKIAKAFDSPQGLIIRKKA